MYVYDLLPELRLVNGIARSLPEERVVGGIGAQDFDFHDYMVNFFVPGGNDELTTAIQQYSPRERLL